MTEISAHDAFGKLEELDEKIDALMSQLWRGFDLPRNKERQRLELELGAAKKERNALWSSHFHIIPQIWPELETETAEDFE